MKQFHVKQSKEIDPTPIIKYNAKQLKTLQFDLSILVSGGIEHRVIHRFTGHYTDLELVEGAFCHFKVHIKKLQPPMKLFIHYQNKKKLDAATEKKERDLTIYYSYNSPKPSEDNNDGMARNTTCISLMPLKGN